MALSPQAINTRSGQRNMIAWSAESQYAADFARNSSPALHSMQAGGESLAG